jgi:hypothetical protein
MDPKLKQEKLDDRAVKRELVEKPGKDDVHEQREHAQPGEGLVGHPDRPGGGEPQPGGGS